MKEKYRFTGRTFEYKGHTLREIQAIGRLRGSIYRLPDVLGGWIESEKNLSQEGACWVEPGCKVYEGAEVSGNCLIVGTSEIFGNSKISGGGSVSDCFVSGSAKIECDKYSHVCNCEISGNVEILGSEIILTNGNYQFFENTKIAGHGIEIEGIISLRGNSKIEGTKIHVCGNIGPANDLEIRGEFYEN